MPRTRKHASSLAGDKGHIKRPPNPWILFRSDALKLLPPPPPGQPPLPQAQQSKIISVMWKEASEETRNEYRALSNKAHMEHRRKYPEYKFRPTKKEVRLRQMEQEREAQKEHRKQARGIASQMRRNSRKGPLPPLLTTTPLAETTHASSSGTTSSSSSTTRHPTLRLSPYTPPPNVPRTHTVAPHIWSPSQWQQRSLPYAQQQVEYGVSPALLQGQASLACEQQIAIPLPAQPDHLHATSYQPNDESVCFIFGEGFDNEQVLNDPRGIKLGDLYSMDQNSFGFLNSSGSPDSSMGDTTGQEDPQTLAGLFSCFTQDDLDFSNIAGPSQPNPPPPVSTVSPIEPDMFAPLFAMLEQLNSVDADAIAGSGFLAPEEQPVVAGPPVYVPPAGATYPAKRRVGAEWDSSTGAMR